MKALIAMSGGVDSAVAAYLMQQKGYHCIGCTMKLYHNEELGISRAHTCCSLDDVEDARSVAYHLGMPHYVFNFSDTFRETVIRNFIESYRTGRTPNPCIDCNRYVKFEALYERARVLGCDCLVTGHYARIEREKGKFVLKKALDASKDQSYVLYSLTQEQLAHTQFPMGALRKAEVRELAREHQFGNAEKPDSQDICFVPDGDYVAAIRRLGGIEPVPGDFLDIEGNKLGTHRGVLCYTIGQHRHLGVSFPERQYVCGLCAEKNTVTLGPAEALYSKTATVTELHWISGEAPTVPIRCKAKVRYRQTEQWATVTPRGAADAELVFDEPQRAITPGQAAVFYDGDTVLGGGTLA
ncbi:MAG: tRNA 2-thiouridine(34) synthase MnmA [Firmicutes bacterium]|nr:tRNA 2-thiouridine(34) synthase MnmA [Bacillota bacterium]